jgi:hypothetical protein
MSAEHEIPGEEDERSWTERIGVVADAGSALFRTRLAIFREEFAAKTILLARGVAAIMIGFGLAVGAMLLLAALLAAVLAHWFGSVALGILAAFVVYGAGAAFAVTAAIRSLRSIKPTEFPVSTEELRRDWNALSDSFSPAAETGPSETGSPEAALVVPSRPPETPGVIREERVENLEDRYRAGAE